ncbi:hypothetical protein [Streptomyces sp. Z26]|uniref:hypothetical protein n=1 Tax=Streptomyces TaxID=1883 RepID=UPI000EF15A56|nr:hypothetical protein [Streptomyces sp. Z26]RLL69376.1 hypothetical protein D7M15_23935 [Streptomyces sp. Z26]
MTTTRDNLLRGSGDARAGLLLLLYGAVVLAWTVHGGWTGSAPLGDLLLVLVDASVPAPPAYLGPYEWVAAAALITVGVLGLRGAPAARGGAVLLGGLLLALSLRETAGLLDATYRESFFATGMGRWALATRVLGLAVAVAVLVLTLSPRGRGASRPEGREPGPPEGRGHRAAGVLLTVQGLANTGWFAYNAHLLWDAGKLGHGGYVRVVVDPTVLADRVGYGTNVTFYEAALACALLAVGPLLVLRPRAARGAALVLAGILLYVAVRGVVALGTVGEFSPYLQEDAAVLRLATLAFALVTALVTLTSTARAADPADVPGGAYAPPAPGDHGQPHVGAGR